MAIDDGHACHCPVTAAERIISGRWTLLILRDLADGAQRFSHLERSLTGISSRTLTQRLKALEIDGVITRSVHDSGACRADYRLTEKGMALLPVIEAMRRWGERWCAVPDAVVESGRTAADAAETLQGA